LVGRIQPGVPGGIIAVVVGNIIAIRPLHQGSLSADFPAIGIVGVEWPAPIVLFDAVPPLAIIAIGVKPIDF